MTTIWLLWHSTPFNIGGIDHVATMAIARTSSDSGLLVLEDLITYRLMQLSETIIRAATHVYKVRHGVTLNELRILVTLSGHERLTLIDISQRTRIDKAWISRSLRALSQRGLVKRTAHPTDNRSTLLSLTNSGRTLMRKLAPLAIERHEQVLAGLNRRDVYRLIDELQKRADKLLVHSTVSPTNDIRPARLRRR